MNLDRPPDAIRAPVRFAGGGDAYARLTRLHDEFARILGAPHVFVRHQGAEHFLTRGPFDTLRHGSSHDQPNASRYDWSDRGDGVLYGWLIGHE